MQFFFSSTFSSSKEGIHFTSDGWNDFGYYTLYSATYVDESKQVYSIGSSSFATLEESQNSYNNKGHNEWVTYSSLDYLPTISTKLDKNTVSLGTIEFYENLYKVFTPEQANEILINLNDIAYDLKLYEENKSYDVIRTSFLRGSNEYNLKHQLNRVATNGVRQIPFNFDLKYSVNNSENRVFSFQVDPNSALPTNVYSLIGNNGTGKTTVIQDIVKCYLRGTEVPSHLIENSSAKLSIYDDYENETFESILFISFSAFDQLKSNYFNDPEKVANFNYVGNSTFLDERQAMKNPQELASDLIENLRNIRKSPERITLWEKEILKLSFDSEISRFINSISNNKFPNVESVSKLSSGQKMILLGLSALVSRIEEKTLIIIDEPESYLHPPLVSAYIRILSDILSQKNGVAIIATHSPVILQEIPKKCVWVLERDFSKNLTVRHPIIETFGENISMIMDDVFGLDIRNSGFYQFLSLLSEKNPDTAKELIANDKLGSEASLFLQIFLEE